MVGAKVVLSVVSPSFMPCFRVVFTGFLGLVRHGCGWFVGWQMVLLCSSASSEWVSGVVLLVSVWLSWCVGEAAVCLVLEFGGFGWFSVGVGVKFPFLGSSVQIGHVCWVVSLGDCPERMGFASCWISCSVHFCGVV